MTIVLGIASGLLVFLIVLIDLLCSAAPGAVGIDRNWTPDVSCSPLHRSGPLRGRIASALERGTGRSNQTPLPCHVRVTRVKQQRG